MFAQTLPTILVVFNVLTILKADVCISHRRSNERISKKSFVLGAVILLGKKLPISDCIEKCCSTKNCTTFMYNNGTSKCFLINCLGSNVCTFAHSKLYSSYSITRTTDVKSPAWIDFSRNISTQRWLAISALVIAVFAMTSLVGLLVYYCYRQRFAVDTKIKGRGKYQILYNANGDDLVGNNHPLF
uniref:MANEC domain n=1 Tax=Schistocephalus solidus TaxID=70667 RepID=A0A0X3PVM5_SCHSO